VRHFRYFVFHGAPCNRRPVVAFCAARASAVTDGGLTAHVHVTNTMKLDAQVLLLHGRRAADCAGFWDLAPAAAAVPPAMYYAHIHTRRGPGGAFSAKRPKGASPLRKRTHICLSINSTNGRKQPVHASFCFASLPIQWPSALALVVRRALRCETRPCFGEQKRQKGVRKRKRASGCTGRNFRGLPNANANAQALLFRCPF
jgi:hypothetical protein